MGLNEPKYRSGEKIVAGDNINYSGENGYVDFVVTQEYPNWETYWKDLGQGAMLSVPSFGSVYVPFDDGDLIFISRKSKNNRV